MQHVPPQDVRRETFIALRARREALQVASDLLYRDTPGDPVPEPPFALPHQRRRRPMGFEALGAIVLLAMMALCVLACVAFAVAEGLIQIPRLR